jgi:flagella basal body P-ring formation protein FlgA
VEEKDADREVFKGFLKVFDRDTFVREYALSGEFELVLNVPILTAVKHIGEEIKPEDIAYKKVPFNNVTPVMVTKTEELIGHVPSRIPLRSGEFIRKNDIKLPHVITRGREVTLVIETPHILMTAKGKAMEDGIVGSTITVENTQSKKKIQGIVKSAGVVEIKLPSQSINEPLIVGRVGQ